MPELPEVETVCRGLDQVMTGRHIVLVEQNRPNLRFPFPENFVQNLASQKINRIIRRAKYILVDLTDDQILLMHLGMSGRFEIMTNKDKSIPGNFHHQKNKSEKLPTDYGKHAHVVFHLDDNTKIIYTDPRRFGFMDLFPKDELENHPQIKTLGIEPLGNQLNGDFIQETFRNKQTNIKATLLNQKIIAGIGNIYACEVLFRSGISPTRKTASLGIKSAKAHKNSEDLASAIRSVLTDAIEAGGSSLRDFSNINGDLGYFQHSFQVYDQAGNSCQKPGCKGIVERIVQNNRSTFFCPACQK